MKDSARNALEVLEEGFEKCMGPLCEVEITDEAIIEFNEKQSEIQCAVLEALRLRKEVAASLAEVKELDAPNRMPAWKRKLAEIVNRMREVEHLQDFIRIIKHVTDALPSTHLGFPAEEHQMRFINLMRFAGITLKAIKPIFGEPPPAFLGEDPALQPSRGVFTDPSGAMHNGSSDDGSLAIIQYVHDLEIIIYEEGLDYLLE